MARRPASAGGRAIVTVVGSMRLLFFNEGNPGFNIMGQAQPETTLRTHATDWQTPELLRLLLDLGGPA